MSIISSDYQINETHSRIDLASVASYIAQLLQRAPDELCRSDAVQHCQTGKYAKTVLCDNDTIRLDTLVCGYPLTNGTKGGTNRLDTLVIS
ncbi:hypothetical protein PoB_003519600 [Plakobranchus ocellatus]|uniref:Uncharacterized protein n=1 Tax=Plakobranchus ocellatus TaxID=259542 RepID=A0AAV4AK66_9GAST|nr:hypothetical protein PoB_003519600 [Plakobranchus ocellatus]